MDSQIVVLVLTALIGLVVLAVRGKLVGLARQTVGAVYRLGINAAYQLSEEGIDWLKSESGIAYRKHLAELAYNSLPAFIGPVPVGLVKQLVSLEQWCRLVENVFEDIVVLADNLIVPDELPLA